MKRLIALVCALLPLLLMGLQYTPNQVIIKTTQPVQLRNNTLGIAALDAQLARSEVTSVKPVFAKTDNRYYLATCERPIAWDALNAVRDAQLELVQPNYLSRLFLVPNDTDYLAQQQAALSAINLPQAWNYSTGNPSVLIAVIDSGLHFDHPDLQNNIFTNTAETPDDGIDNDQNGYVDDWRGWDFVDAPELADMGSGDFIGRDNDATDELNHGTHVAGIIGADSNNNRGICGVNWQSQLLILRAGFKTVNGLGYLQDDDAATAIVYAADMGAQVINLSWGDTNYSPIIADACAYAYQHGCVIVASAGNEGSTPEHVVTYPARLSTTIAVGASDNAGGLASFSSYGPQIDLVAPGSNIYSCYSNTPDNYYALQSGTSMAAPMVTGAVGLLLAVEPTLNFDQIRARLAITSQDLGSVGFDNKFGNGMLDAYSLLTHQPSYNLAVEFPQDEAWISQNASITGTVTADDFMRYSVMYTDASMPGSTDWLSVEYPHVNTPTYHYEPVENDELAWFELPALDGDYLLRLDAVTTQNEHYRLFRAFHIDRSAPVYIDSLSMVMKRYQGECATYALQTAFDEAVDLEVQLSGPGNLSLYSTTTDDVQIIILPTSLPAGEWQVDFTATNRAGLTTQGTFPQTITVDHASVNTTDYLQNLAGNQLVALRKYSDVNNNGNYDFIGLEIEEESYTLKYFERSDTQLTTLFTFPFSGLTWPHDIGDTNGQGLEFIGVKANNAILYETLPGSTWPVDSIWTSSGVYGAAFMDINSDGHDEVAVIKNVEVGSSTQRAVVINRRVGDYFVVEHTLLNTTPTTVKNEFVNKLASGDFDNDGNFDILTADTDGDVMVYEWSPALQSFEMSWYTHLPVKNCYYLAAGNFRGTGATDFCVGGYTTNTSDPAKAYSFFGIFCPTGQDNDYAFCDYFSFGDVQSANSIANADLDGDGDDELVLAASPYVYVIDYQDGDFIPTWMGESAATYQNVVSAIPASTNQTSCIITNQLDSGSISGSVILPSGPFTGPDTPTNFSATVRADGQVQLQWDYPSMAAESFTIYRKLDNEITSLGSSVSTSIVIDEPALGDTVSYRVTAIHNGYTPNESRATLWKSVVPGPAPQLQLVRMNTAATIEISCTAALASQMQNPLLYSLNHQVGHPGSALLKESQSSILLSFTEPLLPYDDYQLTITALTGTNGASSPAITADVLYNEDTTPPRILQAEVTSDYCATIYFSEAMEMASAEDINNYQLTLPSVDPDNSISSISYFDDAEPQVELTFSQKLQYSNQSYFLTINNCRDLAGNAMHATGNQCRFGLTDITTLKHMIVYPNPLNREEDRVSGVNFINLPLHKSGDIRLYDVSGALIFTQSFGPFASPAEYYTWDTRNKAHKRVSSGLYYYLITMGEDQRKGKIVIIQ